MLRESTCGDTETDRGYCRPPPGKQNRLCGGTHHPVGVIYSVHVNLRYKSNRWGCVRVFGSALHFQTVYPVLIVGLQAQSRVRRAFRHRSGRAGRVAGSYSWRSDDHGRPPCQSHVGVILQAPADRAVAFALLTLFQLLQQTKIAWNFN